VLTADGYQVQTCDSLPRLMAHAPFAERDLALVAWQSMQGMLADEHRHELARFAARVPIVLIVPRRWLRLLQQTDLCATALLPKPFDPDELRMCVRDVLGSHGTSPSGRLPPDGRRQPIRR